MRDVKWHACFGPELTPTARLDLVGESNFHASDLHAMRVGFKQRVNMGSSSLQSFSARSW